MKTTCLLRYCCGACTSLGEGYFVTEDIGEGGISVLALERRGAEEHLVDQYAQCPPIDGAGVTIAPDHLGCDIFFGADKGIGSEICYTRFGVNERIRVRIGAVTAAEDHGRSTARVRLLRQIKIRQHDMTRLMEEDI